MKTVQLNSAEIEFLQQAIDTYAMAGLHGREVERVRELRAKLKLNGNGDGDHWNTLESTNLKRCRYNPDSSRLEIDFHTGARWIYLDVPPAIYQELIQSESAGKYFHTEIKPHFEGVPKSEDGDDGGSD